MTSRKQPSLQIPLHKQDERSVCARPSRHPHYYPGAPVGRSLWIPHHPESQLGFPLDSPFSGTDSLQGLLPALHPFFIKVPALPTSSGSNDYISLSWVLLGTWLWVSCGEVRGMSLSGTTEAASASSSRPHPPAANPSVGVRTTNLENSRVCCWIVCPRRQLAAFASSQTQIIPEVNNERAEIL